MRRIRRSVWAAVLVFGMTCGLYDSNAAITLTLGHIYSTYTESPVAGDPVYRNIVEYDANGTVLGSLVIPSLIPNDELRGIAFGPEGLLYAVKVHVGTPGFTVLVLNSSGAVLRAYPMGGIYVWGNGAGGKIAVDQQYIYVAGADNVVRFTLGDPNSGVSIYNSRDGSEEVLDVKILPNGNLYVASPYQVDEITNTGTIVRTVAARNGNDLIGIQGIEYDPVTNKLFVSCLGTLDGTRTLLRLNAWTGAIEATAFFFYAEDLFLTESRNLVIGSRFDAPRIYNENLGFIRTVGSDQRQFVTQYRRIPPTPVPRAAVADFNGDGKPDYVLRNPTTRQTAIWYLNNNVYQGGALGPTLSAGWALEGAADFNRDTHPDYAVFNPTTDRTAIWYLSGPTFIGSAFGPTVPSGWELAATADFNGDGYPDYVLYNATTHQTGIWYLSNNVYVSGGYGPTLPANWSLIGVADFNGDGPYGLYLVQL